MPIELQALFGAAAILVVLVSIEGAIIPLTHGFKWGLGPRDEIRAPTAILGRLKRIIANHLEALAIFAPLILIANLITISTPLTVWGAILFVAARAAFVAVYMIGVPVLRTAVWSVGFTGTLMVGFEVFKAGF
jgi:uncharacterized MAPEG superfamily protein